MKGFHNKVLVIDLGSQDWEEEPVPEHLYENRLGGKGLALELLLSHNPEGVDPLSPENILIFATGPLTDLKVHGSARYGVFTKSPQTGFLSESYSGGTLADYLSRTGYDAVVIKGASESPVWLEISDREVKFHPADELWGKDAFTAEAEVLNRAAAKRGAAAVIGPAGENMVSFACISNNKWRQCGRTGAGAVMGSKKLKAVVFHGEKKREPADPEALDRFFKELAERGKTDKTAAVYKKYGTTIMVRIANTAGAFPTRYWSAGRRENWEEISGDTLLQRFQVSPHACPRCFMACGNLTKVTEGKYKGLELEGPEYETIYAFGGLCLIEKMEDIIYLNDLCDRLGLDTITAGNLAGFVMRASELGAAPEKLEFGDVEGTAKLLQDMALRKGMGEVLAKGVKAAAAAWGLENEAVHVKGLEPAGYEPRVLKGMGLGYAVSQRGACHLRAAFYRAELMGESPPDKLEGKAELFVDYEERCALFDTLILCRFHRDLLGWKELSLLVRAATGLDTDEKKLKQIAAGIIDRGKEFNLREGASDKDDELPPVFHERPLTDSGKLITKEELEKLRSDYYRLRGWDERGIPRGFKEKGE